MECHYLNMMLMLMISHGNFQVLNVCFFTCATLSYTTGADITDYFNYGFTEETWKLYCERQRQMKSEVSQLNKTVSSFTRAHLLCVGLCTYSRQLVPSYDNNNISYYALIVVLMSINSYFNFNIIIIIIIATW